MPFQPTTTTANEVGFQTPPLSQTPYMAFGKGQNFWAKFENLIYFVFAMVKMYIHSNLKGIFIPFIQKSDVIYKPHGRMKSQIADFGQKWSFLSHLATVGYVDPFKLPIKWLWCSF